LMIFQPSFVYSRANHYVKTNFLRVDIPSCYNLWKDLWKKFGKELMY
jgi:hypothetical protein